MWVLCLRASVVGSLGVSFLLLATPHRAFSATSASDNFNRANGSLGAGWTDMTVGGLAISNDAVIGTQAAGNSGDIYTGQAFGSDQFSQVQVTSTPIGGGQWIGPAVRAQNGGQSLYVGIYYGNNGSPELELFKLLNGGWTQLGGAVASGNLAAGTQLALSVTGSTLSFSENGVVEITATDTGLTGGAPGIMAYGTSTAGDWVGGNATTTGTGGGGTFTIGGTVSGLSGTVVLGDNGGDALSVSANGSFTFATPLAQGASYAVTVTTEPSGQFCNVANGSGTVGTANVTNVSVSCAAAGPFSAQYQSTDASNIQYYTFTSPDDGNTPETLRVLQPSHPAAGVTHNFLYVLPVEAGLGSVFGDGLATMASLDAEDQYNLTIVEPTFSIDPWYANNPNDSSLQYETFMTTDLEPWVKANLSTTGTEQNWLIGFSKSGNGAQDLILKHPDLFQLAATWDFPADMASYNSLGSDPADNYGTDANYQANYTLTNAFLAAHKAPFLSQNRIWLGGYFYYQYDVTDYDARLTAEGIAHTLGPMTSASAHSWTSGWVPAALAGLSHDSTLLGSGGTTDTLTFNSEGGSAVSNVSGLDGTTITLPAAPTRAGYTFAGWFAAASGGTVLTSPYTLTGTTTLYAEWSADSTDDFSYTANGGSGSAPSSGSGLDGTTITLPANPFTYPGHTFTGWSDGTLSYPAGSTYLLSSLGTPIVFNAQWSANATDTITFNSEGGSAVSSESGLDGTTITLPAAPTYAGYTFDGWFAASSGGSALTSPYTLAGSVTLYAQWTANPTTSVLIPSKGTTLSGTAATLDASASNATSVEFLLFGGSYGLNGNVLCMATPTKYGWLCSWNTTTVPNGSYTLVSVASNGSQFTASSGVSIAVKNPLPTTAVLIPSKGATLSGSTATLDASASNTTSVEFLLFGGTYGLSGHVLCTATATIYGWVCSWDSTTVPNGSYVLVSLASSPAGSTASAGVSVTVRN